MIAIILTVVLVHSDGVQFVGAEKFETLKDCQIKQSYARQRLINELPAGQRFIVECSVVRTAGKDV